MPSLLVKEISADLLREVNYAASKAGQTQREWVIEQLGHAVSAKAKAKIPEKVSPTESQHTPSLVEWDGPEPPKATSTKKPKPEMPSGLSNTQMQRWIREHR